MRLCAITDRRLFPGDERERCAALLKQAVRWAGAGVEFIQLREKDLPAAALEDLAKRLVKVAHRAALQRGLSEQQRSRVLVNCVNAAGVGAAEIAWKAGADGIHLTGWEAFGGSGHLVGERVREVRRAWPGTPPIVSVACHTVQQAQAASRAGASMVLFAPVFEKPLWDSGGAVVPGAGVITLAEACEAASPVPLFALGGVRTSNVGECIAAGAAGVAGIRLFAAEAWIGLGGV